MRILKTHLLLLPTLSVLLSGCLTLEDFVAMPAWQRADLVCRNEAGTRALLGEADTLRGNIASANQAVLDGFREERHCTTFMVPRHERFCSPPRHPNGPPHCHIREWFEPEERCVVHRVPVDVALEERNIAGWALRLQQTDALIQSRMTPCVQKVLPMPPDLAFQHYDNNTAPN